MNIEAGPPPNPVWQQQARIYHVHFYRQLSNPEPPLVPFWESSEYQITDAGDVGKVLEWAQAEAAGRVIALFVEVRAVPPGPPGMLLLYGRNPTAPGLSW